MEIQYKVMAQYDNPTWNDLQHFCNETDGSGENTYILDKINAGLVALGGGCLTINDFSLNKHDGWDWQVSYQHIY